MGNTNLNRARVKKNDEFYTQIEDIEKEVINYKEQFENKVVYLNCDRPSYIEDGDSIKFNDDGSNFFKFFYLNFEEFKLKKLITTFYDDENPVYKTEYTGGGINGIKKTLLSGNGDFRSNEAIECLKEADIVCTNPPFSLFRKYMDQLMEYEKKFLIIGSINAITYKEIPPLIINNKVWMGYNLPKKFIQPDKTIKHLGNTIWFTNIYTDRKYEDLPLSKKYYGNEDKYQKYDNHDAINVNRLKDIPCDYYGIMGVPITLVRKYNPEQFKIIKITSENLSINGKNLYHRIFIKRKK